MFHLDFSSLIRPASIRFGASDAMGGMNAVSALSEKPDMQRGRIWKDVQSGFSNDSTTLLSADRPIALVLKRQLWSARARLLVTRGLFQRNATGMTVRMCARDASICRVQLGTPFKTSWLRIEDEAVAGAALCGVRCISRSAQGDET